jgi:hypothetical protein
MKAMEGMRASAKFCFLSQRRYYSQPRIAAPTKQILKFSLRTITVQIYSLTNKSILLAVKVAGCSKRNLPMNMPTPMNAPVSAVASPALSSTISYEQVQQATARCLQVHPAIDAVLPKESHLLVELLGLMIYARSSTVDAASLSPFTLDELRRWSAPSPLRAAA